MATPFFRSLGIPKNINVRTETVSEFGYSPMFDFSKGEFFLNADGTFNVRNDKTGFVNLVRKILVTKRYAQLCTGDFYGSQVEELIGQFYTAEELKSEIKRMIIDALIYDPRIVEVGNFTITPAGDTVTVEFSYIDVWGSTQNLKVVY